MRVRVRPRPAFIRAVNDRLTWLAKHRNEEQIESFLTGLTTLRERIEQDPEAGPIVRQDTEHVLRMRLFPRPLPYLVYYGHARARRVTEVYLVRLYASGQARDEVDMAEWPW